MRGRYHKLDHISFIQANLKEMKDQVSQYLKKSNNETVPSVLRPRHYLILSCLQELNTRGSGSREEMQVRELSSERLGNTIDGDKFQSLREGYEREKNKVVKIKRQVNNLNKSSTGDVDCLLPNICQLRLDLDQGGNRISQRKNLLEGKTIDCSQEIQRSECLGRDQRYHSIDLNHQFKLSQNLEGQNSGLKVTNKWLSASKSRELIKTLRQKHSWAEQRGQVEAKSPIYDQDVALDLTKEKLEQPESAKDKGKLVYHQRRESIMKRRIEANRKLAKDAQHHHSKPIPLKQQLQGNNKKVFRFDKGETLPEPAFKKTDKMRQVQANNQCSPWRDVNPKKEPSLLQAQIF